MYSLLPNHYVPEPEAEALARYDGFGRELFGLLRHDLPQVVFEFARNPAEQRDDVWAICHCGLQAFGIQLDPLIEVIVLFDEERCEEIGTWQDDPVGYAIARIREQYAHAI